MLWNITKLNSSILGLTKIPLQGHGSKKIVVGETEVSGEVEVVAQDH